MRKPSTQVILEDLRQSLKPLLSGIIKDASTYPSPDKLAGMVAGLLLKFDGEESNLFSPENYPALNPLEYKVGHNIGKYRGDELRNQFLLALDHATASKETVTEKGDK